MLQGEVRAQEADAEPGRHLLVAAAPVGVGGVQLGDELADDEVHILAGDAVLEQLAVAGLLGLPVHAVHAGVVEHVALEAPGVIEDLLPLGARINGHHQLARG